MIAEVYDPDRLVVRMVLERGRRLDPDKVGRVILHDRSGSGRHPATIARHFLSRGTDGSLDQVLELDPGSTDGTGLSPGRMVSVRLVLGTERLRRRGLDLVVGR